MNSEIKSHIKKLGDAFDKFPWHDANAYAAFLAQTYYYTSHTSRILALAGARFDLDSNSVHQRFLNHAAEEMHHERMADKDVKALGFTLKDFPEFPSTRSFYQVHYHTIDRVGPWSIFGYIVALEGLAAERGTEVYNRIKSFHGEKASTFMKVHAAEDIEHMKEAEKQLEALPPGEIGNVIAHLETSCFLYTAIMQESIAYGAHMKIKKAV
jgi:hypothetical protein